MNIPKASELKAAVKQAAEAEPDKRYQMLPDGSCAYTHHENGQDVPGCIVGVGYFILGVPISSEDEVNQGVGVASLPGYGMLDDDSGDSMRWLTHVQERQDDGYSWGYAVEAADKLMVDVYDEDDE